MKSTLEFGVIVLALLGVSLLRNQGVLADPPPGQPKPPFDLAPQAPGTALGDTATRSPDEGNPFASKPKLQLPDTEPAANRDNPFATRRGEEVGQQLPATRQTPRLAAPGLTTPPGGQPRRGLNTSPLTARERTAATESKLAQEMRLEFVRMPLDQLCAQLSEDYDLPYHLDRQAIEDLGVSLDAEITIQIRKISLETGLDLLTDHHGLSWYIRDGVIVITTPRVAASKFETRVYPVQSLISGALGAAPSHDEERLMKLIEASCGAQPWQEGASLDIYRGALVVTQTGRVHRDVDRLLKKLDELTTKPLPLLQPMQQPLQQPAALIELPAY
ncbi:MAG: STN domain-containing protein [Planctomycetales bacterium]|nr:STN domain-containing protein [Planctomycetales bacterium]